MQIDDKIVSLPALAERWRVEETTLRDPRWRKRVGLPLVKIGGRVLGVFEADVVAVEQRGRECLREEQPA